jgi:pimeloyl-ACP methyl ester carboxylesterase
MLNTATIRQAGYVPINGLQLYYQIHGSGPALVLIHGGLGTIEMFGELLPALARRHRVVAVELQGHGHTADGDRPFRFELLADDVATLIRRLALQSAAVLGFSLGGGVALQTAIRHPEAVRKLVVVSAPFRRSGWHPEVLAGMGLLNAETAEAMVESPMYAAYSRVAPRLEDWPMLVAKTGDLLRQDYDWSEDVAALSVPTLIVAGDGDSLSPAHAVEMFALLGGGRCDGVTDGLPASRLAILPGTTHYDILSPALAPVVASFLHASGEGENEAENSPSAIVTATAGPI